MKVLFIDIEMRHQHLHKNLFPSSWVVDYNATTVGSYDIVIIDCDVCKLDDKIAWSHWVRQSDGGTPKKELKDEYLEKRTWGSSERYSSIYKNILEQLKSVQYKKLILIDPGDRAIVSSGLRWLSSNGYSVDLVLKREYRRTHTWDYTSIVKPFPFLTFDGKACNVLYQAKDITASSGGTGCFFIGDPLLRVELGMSDEWVNRYDMLLAMKKLNCIDWYTNRLQKEEYLSLFKTHKSFLHLNGTGHLCSRFFEGLGMGCLCIMQEHDVVFPMGSPVHPSLIFKTPDEAKEIIERVDSDSAYYNMCMQYQTDVILEHFNRDKLGEYILECLDDV